MGDILPARPAALRAKAPGPDGPAAQDSTPLLEERHQEVAYDSALAAFLQKTGRLGSLA
jgi:hypothetical protein